MKVIDIIRKADDETVAKIIGSVIVMNTEKITMEEAMDMDYPATLKYLQSDMEIDYKPTNADRIRGMTDEELENLLNKAVFCGGLVRSEQTSAECKGCSYPFCSPERYVEWLKKEID
ncbi:MAG: hypothetical protein UHN47_03605 [Lachnospiraceae bacterium]|nr:hypothetical protein [Lachnospiraceae bacterium]